MMRRLARLANERRRLRIQDAFRGLGGVSVITDRTTGEVIEIWATQEQAEASIARCAEFMDQDYRVVSWTVQGLADA